MLIDVTDLKFDTLNFVRKYDPVRYKRGVGIYQAENVVITEVNKTVYGDYLVDAEAKGNYGDYLVELQIKGKMIIDSTCTCEDFKNGNICKHIIATSMEVIKPHAASTIDGKEKYLEQQKRKEEERKRQIEEERKRKIYEYKYTPGMDFLNKFKNVNENALKGNKIELKTLYDEAIKLKSENNSELATSVNLEVNAYFVDRESVKVTFKIGKNRMYILSNVSDFYDAYINEEEIYYGKQLRLIPKKENFSEESQKIFDFIIEYGKIIKYGNIYSDYRYSGVSNKEIFVSENDIDKVFEICDEIYIKDYYGDAEKFKLTNEKLDIEFILSQEEIDENINYHYIELSDKNEKEFVFKLNIEGFRAIYSLNYIYILYNEKIYKFKYDLNFKKLIETFIYEKNILIPKDKIEEFKSYVLPKVKHLKLENMPEEVIKEADIVNELASKILLDTDDDSNIMLELKFCYDDKEFNVLDKNYEKFIKENNIIRDVPKEAEIIQRLFIDGFEFSKSKTYFTLKDADSTYEFLTQKIENYMNDFEVLATDKFKNKQIKQPKISNIGIRVENGLLELDLSKINIDIKEIKSILKDYNVKKKYHKLKNGDFVDLINNKDLDLLDEMTTTLDIDYSKIENGIAKLPVNRSIYLEKLMELNNDVKVSKNEDFTKLIDNLENPEITSEIEIDKEFEDKLRDYQKIGYKWLKTLEYYKFGGILADDMGLGKTIQVIALLKSQLNSKNRETSIVVCPSTLVLNWKAEVEKWCNDIHVLIIKGNAEERIERINNYKNYDLIITSYDLLKRDIENYEDKKFKYIIADEAQYIKNATTQNATSLKTLNGEIRFALTGTPIENSIAELWSIFDFIMPGYLYSYSKFKKKFEEPILKEENKEVLVRLKKLISPFILRRVKKDVLTELPDKNITIMNNEMDEEQEKIYLSYLAQTKKEVAEELDNSSFEKSRFKILMLLTRLRQICCHPSLFIENYKGDSGKLKQCMDLVTDAIEAGHKVLLFSSYTSMFEIIEERLKKSKIEYFKLVGNTPVGTRIEMVDEFNKNNDIKVFLISLKAGGTGLNLTSADVVIHYDPWWNISSENQATDRAYRIGQKNSVQVYKLITSNSIEEKINKMQERKEKLSKDILSTEETFISKLSKDEILNLFE